MAGAHRCRASLLRRAWNLAYSCLSPLGVVLICPQCHERQKCARSRRRTFTDYVLGLSGVRPWRCAGCQTRFFAWRVPVRMVFTVHCGRFAAICNSRATHPESWKAGSDHWDGSAGFPPIAAHPPVSVSTLCAHTTALLLWRIAVEPQAAPELSHVSRISPSSPALVWNSPANCGKFLCRGLSLYPQGRANR